MLLALFANDKDFGVKIISQNLALDLPEDFGVEFTTQALVGGYYNNSFLKRFLGLFLGGFFLLILFAVELLLIDKFFIKIELSEHLRGFIDKPF